VRRPFDFFVLRLDIEISTKKSTNFQLILRRSTWRSIVGEFMQEGPWQVLFDVVVVVVVVVVTGFIWLLQW
jgi:hypothetical protein